MRDVHTWIRELQDAGPVVSERRGKDPLRFTDKALGIEVVQILPGDCYVSSRDELLSTVLGSCITVCLHEPSQRLGGMNHFLLPGGDDALVGTAEATRYGKHAMNELVRTMIELGADISIVEAKLFGGGTMFSSEQDVGQRNINYADEFLKSAKITVASRDVGLPFSRKIRFSPVTGKVMVKRLPSLHGHHRSVRDKYSDLSDGRASPGSNDDSWRICG